MFGGGTVRASGRVKGMAQVVALIVLALALAGCASTLRYTPDQQPSGVPISADYHVLADRLRVEIDTGGYRLEDAQILRPDGGTVRPQTIEHPSFRGGGGLGFGLGVGGVHWGGGGGVGVGTGVGVGIGSGRAEGNTVVFFTLDQVGPAPWRLRVKVVGTQPVDIVLDPGTSRAR
jgi:hypothetical protein